MTVRWHLFGPARDFSGQCEGRAKRWWQDGVRPRVRSFEDWADPGTDPAGEGTGGAGEPDVAGRCPSV